MLIFATNCLTECMLSTISDTRRGFSASSPVYWDHVLHVCFWWQHCAVCCLPCRITAISAGGNHSMALTVAGGLLGFGQNSYGALGTGDLAHRFKPTKINVSLHDRSNTSCRRVVQVVCGSQHTIALVSNNGRMRINTTGQTADVSLKTRSMFVTLVRIPQEES